MKSKKPEQKTPSEFRKRAEEKLKAKTTAPKTMSDKETLQLIHELQVHQIELEMQNDELRKAQAELEESRAKYFDFYDFAPSGFFTFDKHGLILEANLTAAKELGIERSLLINKPFRAYIVTEDRKIFDSHLQKVFNTDNRQTCEIRLTKEFISKAPSPLPSPSRGEGYITTPPLRGGDKGEGEVCGFTNDRISKRKDGSGFYAQLESLATHDMQGHTLCRTSTIDITETVQLREKLHAMSINDELTDLYNRRGFLTLAKQQIKIADRTKMDQMNKEMLLLFIDIDNLKQINDKLGHGEGDIALIETAKILKKTFRASDIIARFGGDEFAVLALETREDKIVCERIQKNLDAYNALGTHSYTLSISIGVTIYNPAKPCILDKLISQADSAMYEQKKSKKRGASDEIKENRTENAF